VEKDVAIELYKQNLDIIREVGNKEADHTTVKIGDTVTNADTMMVDERISGGRPKPRTPVKKDSSSSYDSNSSYNSNSSGSNTSSDDDY
jgi:hypothetical protein